MIVPAHDRIRRKHEPPRPHGRSALTGRLQILFGLVISGLPQYGHAMVSAEEVGPDHRLYKHLVMIEPPDADKHEAGGPVFAPQAEQLVLIAIVSWSDCQSSGGLTALSSQRAK